jgi:hypothetical protein
VGAENFQPIDLDDLLLEDKRPIRLSLLRPTRFNRQFFEDLKSQQISFATILKDRSSLLPLIKSK